MLCVYSSAVFAWGRPLCAQILPGQGRSQQPSILGTRNTGLRDGEDRILLRSLVLTQYRSVTVRRTDRQTDGRICRRIQRLQSVLALSLGCAVKTYKYYY